MVLTEGVRNEQKVAWLLEAAIQGYVDLEHDDGMVTLARGDRRDGETAYELELAFGDRDWLWLGSYDRRFAPRGLRSATACRRGSAAAGCGTPPATGGGRWRTSPGWCSP